MCAYMCACMHKRTNTHIHRWMDGWMCTGTSACLRLLVEVQPQVRANMPGWLLSFCSAWYVSSRAVPLTGRVELRGGTRVVAHGKETRELRAARRRRTVHKQLRGAVHRLCISLRPSQIRRTVMVQGVVHGSCVTQQAHESHEVLNCKHIRN